MTQEENPKPRQNTWLKNKDGLWLVRVPGECPQEGDVVMVHRKDQTFSMEKISEVVWSSRTGAFHLCLAEGSIPDLKWPKPTGELVRTLTTKSERVFQEERILEYLKDKVRGRTLREVYEKGFTGINSLEVVRNRLESLYSRGLVLKLPPTRLGGAVFFQYVPTDLDKASPPIPETNAGVDPVTPVKPAVSQPVADPKDLKASFMSDLQDFLSKHPNVVGLQGRRDADGVWLVEWTQTAWGEFKFKFKV